MGTRRYVRLHFALLSLVIAFAIASLLLLTARPHTAVRAQVLIAPDMGELAGEIGFSEEDTATLLDGGMLVESPGFRFADDPGGPPTLDLPWVQLQGVGAAQVTLGDDFVFGQGGDDLICGGPSDDLTVVCGGEPLSTGQDFVVVWGDLGGPMPPDGPLHVNVSAPMHAGDGTTWTPMDSYPGDTWGAPRTSRTPPGVPIRGARPPCR